jgi:ERCC4-type nuclease
MKFEEWKRMVEIIVDSREKKILHLTDYFKSESLKYSVDKLDVADYGFYVDGTLQKCLIERKNSLDEISQNFSSGRERFKKEFERLGDNTCYLVIENNTLADLMNGEYRSNLNKNAFLASLISFENKYNIRTYFTSAKNSGELIAKLFYYWYRNKNK